MNITLIHFILLIAATWRMSNLLANEDGPFHMFQALRGRVARMEVRSRRKKGLVARMHLYEGVNCEYCNSVWFGVMLTFVYCISPLAALAIALPLALSTGAIVIKKVVFVLSGIDSYFDNLNRERSSK